MATVLSSALLRRRGIGSFIEALADGDPIAVTMLVLGAAGIVGIVVLSRHHKTTHDALLAQDAREHGRDMALVRRAAREHRASYSILAIVWIGIGLFLGISGALLSPGVGLFVFALCACGAGVCKLKQTTNPEVDVHPIVVLARDKPQTVTVASWAADRGGIHLSLKATDPGETHSVRLDTSWGGELIQRLPAIFPSARFVRSGVT
jgi:hypothetical protein